MRHLSHLDFITKECGDESKILKSKGIMELDGQRHLVSPGMVVFIAAGVEHGIANTGFEDLIFVVAASPPQDMPRPE